MSVSNFVRATIKSAVSSGATTIEVDTASSPFNNPPSSGRGFMVDSLDSPTKWEEFTWTGRSAITGGYQLTGVTRNADSNTGAAQAFDAGHYVVQSVSGTTKVVTDEAQTFTAEQTFNSGASIPVDGQNLEFKHDSDAGSTRNIFTLSKDGTVMWDYAHDYDDEDLHLRKQNASGAYRVNSITVFASTTGIASPTALVTLDNVARVGNIQEWLKNSSTQVASIDNDGYFRLGSGSADSLLDVDGEIAIKDGMSAPSATSGKAKIYVDSSDGDLKVVFGDGTVKTIATDS